MLKQSTGMGQLLAQLESNQVLFRDLFKTLFRFTRDLLNSETGISIVQMDNHTECLEQSGDIALQSTLQRHTMERMAESPDPNLVLLDRSSELYFATIPIILKFDEEFPRIIIGMILQLPSAVVRALAMERIQLISSIGRLSLQKLLQKQRIDLLSAINTFTGEHHDPTFQRNEWPGLLRLQLRLNRVWVGRYRRKRIQDFDVSEPSSVTKESPVSRSIRALMEETADAAPKNSALRPGGTYGQHHQRTLMSCFPESSFAFIPIMDDDQVIYVIALEDSDPVALALAQIAIQQAQPVFAQKRSRPDSPPTSGWMKMLWPPYTNIHLAYAAGLAFVLLGFYPVDDQVEASFSVEPAIKQIITAPFEGHLAESNAEVGSRVNANETVLATLDPSELDLNLASITAEYGAAMKRSAIARANANPAERQRALFEADKLKADINRLRYQLKLSRITSPIDGIVLSGDLRRMIGRNLARGEILFEIAPTDDLQFEVFVLDKDIQRIREEQPGEALADAFPGHNFPFIVKRIYPLSETVSTRNMFRVIGVSDPHHQSLNSNSEGLRPGMQGLARIKVGSTILVWQLLRPVVNQIRNFFWI